MCYPTSQEDVKMNPVMVRAGHKAWETRRANEAARSAAAHKAWKTIRAKKAALSAAAKKAWKTRRSA